MRSLSSSYLCPLKVIRLSSLICIFLKKVNIHKHTKAIPLYLISVLFFKLKVYPEGHSLSKPVDLLSFFNGFIVFGFQKRNATWFLHT